MQSLLACSQSQRSAKTNKQTKKCRIRWMDARVGSHTSVRSKSKYGMSCDAQPQPIHACRTTIFTFWSAWNFMLYEKCRLNDTKINFNFQFFLNFCLGLPFLLSLLRLPLFYIICYYFLTLEGMHWKRATEKFIFGFVCRCHAHIKEKKKTFRTIQFNSNEMKQ